MRTAHPSRGNSLSLEDSSRAFASASTSQEVSPSDSAGLPLDASLCDHHVTVLFGSTSSANWWASLPGPHDSIDGCYERAAKRRRADGDCGAEVWIPCWLSVTDRICEMAASNTIRISLVG